MPRGRVAENSSVRRLVRRRFEDEFHVLAKTEIEHLVGLVEHDRLQFRNVEAAAPQMIAEPPRRADHDMRACGQLTLLATRIHAADTGNDARIRILIEPGEFAMHLKSKLAGRRDDQRKRSRGPLEPLGTVKQILRNRQTIGDRLARTSLRRNQEIAAGGVVGQHRGLDLCKPIEVAFRQSSGERRMGGQ